VPTIHRLLRNAGLGFGRPQHTVSSPDPEYAVKNVWPAPFARGLKLARSGLAQTYPA
jgi:hypothetical protein